MNSESKRSRSGAAVALAMVILLPILYVLSVGPAVMLVETTGTENELGPILEVFYFPVVWLHENTPLRGPLDAYVKLWEGW